MGNVLHMMGILRALSQLCSKDGLGKFSLKTKKWMMTDAHHFELVEKSPGKA